MKVRLTKISEAPNPLIKVGDPETYKYGQINFTSVPIDYTVEGNLCYDVEVGLPVIMQREKRNGVVAPGVLRTSPVTKITENGFETLNSVYVIEKL